MHVSDRLAGVPRYRWQRRHTGAEDDFFHAAAVAGDGSLIRARVSSDGTLYLQRVTSPGPGSDFSSWSAQGSVATSAGIALTSRGSTVLLFYVHTDGVTIKVRESIDNGTTFGTASTVVTTGAAVTYLAAGVSDADVVALFYTVGTTVNVVKRTAGVWGSHAAWSNSVGSITGLACVYNLDWDLALTGSDSGSNLYVWSLLYGDGYGQSAGTWSSLTVVEQASSGSGVAFKSPFVDAPDVYRLFFIETFAGPVSYSRPHWTATTPLAGYADSYWREPVPFDLTSGYGMAMAHGGGSAWLSTPFGVWQAASVPASIDLTDDVLEVELSSGPSAGKLTVTLRNDDGRYNDLLFGGGGDGAMSLGAEVSVSPGYRTTNGVATSNGPAFILLGWEHRSAPGESTLILHATDGWWLLDAWRARRQFAWAVGSRNVAQLLGFVLARAGLDTAALSYSPPFVDHFPAFTIQPGESARSAVNRLLSMVQDRLIIEGGIGYTINPQAIDASEYSYGTSHPLLEANYATHVSATNEIRVHGNAIYAESFAWPDIEQLIPQPTAVLDLNLTTEAASGARATANLRRTAIDTPHGHITVPTNAGQQLYDVIDLTDPRVNLTTAKARVLSLTMTYRRQSNHPRYNLRLDLGGV